MSFVRLNFPNDFEKFKNLYSLSIYGSGDTKFDKVPSSLGQLSKLEELNIRYIPMDKFPYTLTNLENLKILSLLECHCTKIEDVLDIVSKIHSLNIIKIDDIDDDCLKS